MRRADRAHDVGDDVHRPPLHRAVEELAELAVGLVGRHPVVVRPRLLLRLRADEGQVLDAGDVVRVGAVEVAAGQLLLVERDEDARRDGDGRQPLLLLLRAVAPDDAVGLAEAARTPRPRRGGAGWRKGLCRRRPRWRCSWRSPPRGDDDRIRTHAKDPYHNRRMSEPGPPLSLRLLGLYPKKAGSAAVGVAARAPLPRSLREPLLGRFAASYGVDLAEAEKPLRRVRLLPRLLHPAAEAGPPPAGPGRSRRTQLAGRRRAHRLGPRRGRDAHPGQGAPVPPRRAPRGRSARRAVRGRAPTRRSTSRRRTTTGSTSRARAASSPSGASRESSGP